MGFRSIGVLAIGVRGVSVLFEVVDPDDAAEEEEEEDPDWEISPPT